MICKESCCARPTPDKLTASKGSKVIMLVISLQAMMSGLNQQRHNFGQWRGGLSPETHGSQLDPMTAANNPFCGTPRLVLGPDGQQLTLARKLKQQNPEVGTKPAVDTDFAARNSMLHLAYPAFLLFLGQQTKTW